MADDWEDWEDDNFQPSVPVTAGQAALAKAKEPDVAKFAGEDEEAEERPAWQNSIPKSQQKKAAARPAYEDRGAVSLPDNDEPLDDPLAEKLRKQKLVEDADLRAAQELFGGEDIDLESFAPKSAKDFEQLGRFVSIKFFNPHAKSAHYKLLLKALLKEALQSLEVQQVKDVETSIAGIRSDKLKEEKARAASSKATGKKKSLNAGRGGGTAGLDDYQFDTALDDDDFM